MNSSEIDGGISRITSVGRWCGRFVGAILGMLLGGASGWVFNEQWGWLIGLLPGAVGGAVLGEQIFVISGGKIKRVMVGAIIGASIPAIDTITTQMSTAAVLAATAMGVFIGATIAVDVRTAITWGIRQAKSTSLIGIPFGIVYMASRPNPPLDNLWGSIVTLIEGAFLGLLIGAATGVIIGVLFFVASKLIAPGPFPLKKAKDTNDGERHRA